MLSALGEFSTASLSSRFTTLTRHFIAISTQQIEGYHRKPLLTFPVLATNCRFLLETIAVVLSLYEAQMSALAILSQPRKRSVVRFQSHDLGALHQSSPRRLPN